MTRLATALLGDSIVIPPSTGIRKREKKIGKKPLTTKNNNEIKQGKKKKSSAGTILNGKK